MQIAVAIDPERGEHADGPMVPIMTQLLEADRLPKEEIERLRSILEEWE